MARLSYYCTCGQSVWFSGGDLQELADAFKDAIAKFHEKHSADGHQICTTRKAANEAKKRLKTESKD